MNPFVLSDSYKLGHVRQMPDGTEFVYENFTPRGNSHFDCPAEFKMDGIIFFGLQAVLKKMQTLWQNEFFGIGDFESLYAQYAKDTKHYTPFPKDKMKELWEYGRLPIKIKALSEGSFVNTKIPVFTIINTQPEFSWFPGYIETYLSAELWKLCTTATTAFHYRKVLSHWCEKTGGDRGFIDYQGHDFSMRGMSGIEDAISSGAAHLLSFSGSDTIAAHLWAEKYYGDEEVFSTSIPATEHSVMCIGGEENEKETIRRLIQDVYPTGPVAIVSDSWDFWNVITNTAKELKDVIMNRGGDSKVVFRPDSGDPVKIICGEEIKRFTTAQLDSGWVDDYIDNKICSETPHGKCGPSQVNEIIMVDEKYFEVTYEFDWNRYDKQFYYLEEINLVHKVEVEPKPEYLGAVECLWNIFGGTVNEKGYKTLDKHVGLIYGDSITLERADLILKGLEAKGFASDNIVFGIGSFTYQRVTRDTFGFAVKATWAQKNTSVGYNTDINIIKSPKTDSGLKKSATGLLMVEKSPEGYSLVEKADYFQEDAGELRRVFEDGIFHHEDSFMTVKQRVLGQF